MPQYRTVTSFVVLHVIDNNVAAAIKRTATRINWHNYIASELIANIFIYTLAECFDFLFVHSKLQCSCVGDGVCVSPSHLVHCNFARHIFPRTEWKHKLHSSLLRMIFGFVNFVDFRNLIKYLLTLVAVFIAWRFDFREFVHSFTNSQVDSDTAFIVRSFAQCRQNISILSWN